MRSVCRYFMEESMLLSHSSNKIKTISAVNLLLKNASLLASENTRNTAVTVNIGVIMIKI